MGGCLSICTTNYLEDENANKNNRSKNQLPMNDISKLINSNFNHKRKSKRSNSAPIKPVKIKFQIGLITRSSKSKKEIFNFEEIIDGKKNKNLGKRRNTLDSLCMSDFNDEDAQKKRMEEIWKSLSTKLVLNYEQESQTQSDDDEEDDEISDIKISLEEEKEKKDVIIDDKEINVKKIEKEYIPKKVNINEHLENKENYEKETEYTNKKEEINNDLNKEINHKKGIRELVITKGKKEGEDDLEEKEEDEE